MTYGEYIYAVWQTQPELAATVKIGCHRGTREQLRHRYQTYLGRSMGDLLFPCQDRKRVEAAVFELLKAYHVENELYRRGCLDGLHEVVMSVPGVSDVVSLDSRPPPVSIWRCPKCEKKYHNFDRVIEHYDRCPVRKLTDPVGLEEHERCARAQLFEDELAQRAAAA